jgi:uncharacterized membrane protein
MFARRVLTPAAAVVAGFLAAGCGTSPTGGGTSGTKSDGTAVNKNDTFTVKGPATATTIRQGEKQNIDLSLDRGKDFKESVSLSADNPPKGITVTMDKKTVNASDPEKVVMTVEAAKDAPIGEHLIKVMAKPGTGKETSLDVKVKVDAAK